jgi:hypothetical protein
MRGLIFGVVLVTAASPSYASCKSEITELEARVKHLAPDIKRAVTARLAKATKVEPASETECHNEVTKARRLMRDRLPKEPVDPRAPKQPAQGKPYNTVR